MLLYSWKGVKIEMVESRYTFTPLEAKGQRVTLNSSDVKIDIMGFELFNDFTGTVFLKGICQAFTKNKFTEDSYENEKGYELTIKKVQKDKVAYLRFEVTQDGEAQTEFYHFHEVCMMDVALGKALNVFSLSSVPDQDQCRYKNEPLQVF